MSEIVKTYMTWNDFDKDITDFIGYLNEKSFNDSDTVILGMKRGGLPTAVTLSNKMNLPISTVVFQTRDGNDTVPTFLEPELIRKAKKIIIPDDIYDSGLTVEKTIEALQKEFGIDMTQLIGCFHYASEAIDTATIKTYKFSRPKNGAWIVFPWE